MVLMFENFRTSAISSTLFYSDKTSTVSDIFPRGSKDAFMISISEVLLNNHSEVKKSWFYYKGCSKGYNYYFISFRI